MIWLNRGGARQGASRKKHAKRCGKSMQTIHTNKSTHKSIGSKASCTWCAAGLGSHWSLGKNTAWVGWTEAGEGSCFLWYKDTSQCSCPHAKFIQKSSQDTAACGIKMEIVCDFKSRLRHGFYYHMHTVKPTCHDDQSVFSSTCKQVHTLVSAALKTASPAEVLQTA